MNANTILERAAKLHHPTFIVAGASYRGEGAWREFAAKPPYFAQLTIALDEAEAARARETDFNALEDQRARGREEARTPDPELAEEVRREAADAHERHVAERPARVEALLERIAAALEKRGA